MSKMWIKPFCRFAAAAAAVALPAWAGPPFVTDDPEPTDLGHWEIYNFVSGAHTPGDTAAEAGFDINYGAWKDVQLTAVIPVSFGDHTQAGLGDIELAAKYKFLHQADGSPMPDVAFFPRLFAPTAARQFGSQRLNLLLPIWAQKDFGKWSLFGGGGYQINPGTDHRDFWQGGVGLTRALSERLSLGGEVYFQTADARDGKTFAGLNAGALYKLNDHWSLLGSAGPGLQNAREGGQYDFYFTLEATY